MQRMRFDEREAHGTELSIADSAHKGNVKVAGELGRASAEYMRKNKILVLSVLRRSEKGGPGRIDISVAD